MASRWLVDLLEHAVLLDYSSRQRVMRGCLSVKLAALVSTPAVMVFRNGRCSIHHWESQMLSGSAIGARYPSTKPASSAQRVPFACKLAGQ